MKPVLVAVVLLMTTLIAPLAAAESSWWEKAASLFRKVEPAAATASTDPTVLELGDAFREALRIGADHVVARLGAVDGFNGDQSIRIPLPPELDIVKSWMGKIGMSSLVDDFEVQLNRAAEAATPRARALFLDSISKMTFDDIKRIYDGPDDAATQYFRQQMGGPLEEEIRPLIADSLSQVGAVRTFDDIIGRYQSLPFVPDVKTELTGHVVNRSIDGIFFYMAKEEAAMRSDPLRHTSDLLKKVFSAAKAAR